MRDDQDELLKALAYQESLLQNPQQVADYRQYCKNFPQGICDTQARIAIANAVHAEVGPHKRMAIHIAVRDAQDRANERERTAAREEAQAAEAEAKANEALERQQSQERQQAEDKAEAQRAATEAKRAQERQQLQEQQERVARTEAARTEPFPGSVKRFDAALQQRHAEREEQRLGGLERINNADMDRLAEIGPYRPNYRLLSPNQQFDKERQEAPKPDIRQEGADADRYSLAAYKARGNGPAPQQTKPSGFLDRDNPTTDKSKGQQVAKDMNEAAGEVLGRSHGMRRR